jgi:hypothetical protein
MPQATPARRPPAPSVTNIAASVLILSGEPVRTFTTTRPRQGGMALEPSELSTVDYD